MNFRMLLTEEKYNDTLEAGVEKTIKIAANHIKFMMKHAHMTLQQAIDQLRTESILGPRSMERVLALINGNQAVTEANEKPMSKKAQVSTLWKQGHSVNDIEKTLGGKIKFKDGAPITNIKNDLSDGNFEFEESLDKTDSVKNEATDPVLDTKVTVYDRIYKAKVFKSRDEANKFMEEHKGKFGVILVKDGDIYVANVNDKGSVKTEENVIDESKNSVKFRLAGRLPKFINELHLTSHNRVKLFDDTVFHRNDINNDISADSDVFSKYFKFEKSSGIYRCITSDKIPLADVFKIDTQRLNEDKDYDKQKSLYKYFVVRLGKIATGWDYLEDAKDDMKEQNENYGEGYAKIYQRKGLTSLGLNPDNKEDWKCPVNESQEENTNVQDIVSAHKDELRAYFASDDVELDPEIFNKLAQALNMPYDVAKARSADPKDWLREKLGRLINEDITADMDNAKSKLDSNVDDHNLPEQGRTYIHECMKQCINGTIPKMEPLMTGKYDGAILKECLDQISEAIVGGEWGTSVLNGSIIPPLLSEGEIKLDSSDKEMLTSMLSAKLDSLKQQIYNLLVKKGYDGEQVTSYFQTMKDQVMKAIEQVVGSEEQLDESNEENEHGKVFYYNGDKAEYTGKSEMLHGKKAYEAVWIDGIKKDQIFTTYRNPGTGKLEI